MFHSFSAASGINRIKLTPSHIHILKYLGISSSSMLCAIVGGEQVTTEHVRILKTINPAIRIYNEYGPTEATVGCTIKELQEERPVVIGKPISNARIYILDKKQRLCAIGITGEIYIGGAGVARGYLNRPQLSSERFIPDPFEAGGRLYKTGDAARWLSDGDLYFLGRMDDQVKIRGYRIEPGEIEAVIQNYPGITAAVVTATQKANEDRELVAYFVSEQPLSLIELRAFLSQSLPAYMVPAHFIKLDNLPLTQNGKIDKKKLPDPVGVAAAALASYMAPRNEMEEKLVQIWQEILGREKIGIQDNFFDAGGNSIKIIRLAKLVSATLDTDISIAHLFQYPTIKDMVDYMLKKQVAVEEEFDRNELIDDLNKFNIV